MAPELLLLSSTMDVDENDPPSPSAGHSSIGPTYDAARADVWSLGCTLYLTAVGAYPFEDPAAPANVSAMLRNAMAGRYRPLPGRCSDPLRDLLARMLVPDPARRIMLEEVARHAWMRGQPS